MTMERDTDYELARNFTVVDAVEKDGNIKKCLLRIEKKKGNRKRYVTFENIFDAIDEHHMDGVKHTGRLLTSFSKNFLCFEL